MVVKSDTYAESKEKSKNLMESDFSGYSKLCEEVLSLEGVRYCAARDELGSEIAGGQKKGIERMESDEEREGSEHRVVIMSGLMDSFPSSFGSPYSLSVKFGNLAMFVFPVTKRISVHVTIEPDLSPEFTTKIERMIENWKNGNPT